MIDNKKFYLRFNLKLSFTRFKQLSIFAPMFKQLSKAITLITVAGFWNVLATNILNNPNNDISAPPKLDGPVNPAPELAKYYESCNKFGNDVRISLLTLIGACVHNSGSTATIEHIEETLCKSDVLRNSLKDIAKYFLSDISVFMKTCLTVYLEVGRYFINNMKASETPTEHLIELASEVVTKENDNNGSAMITGVLALKKIFNEFRQELQVLELPFDLDKSQILKYIRLFLNDIYTATDKWAKLNSDLGLNVLSVLVDTCISDMEMRILGEDEIHTRVWKIYGSVKNRIIDNKEIQKFDFLSLRMDTGGLSSEKLKIFNTQFLNNISITIGEVKKLILGYDTVDKTLTDGPNLVNMIPTEGSKTMEDSQ